MKSINTIFNKNGKPVIEWVDAFGTWEESFDSIAEMNETLAEYYEAIREKVDSMPDYASFMELYCFAGTSMHELAA